MPNYALGKYAFERMLPELRDTLTVNGVDYGSSIRALAAAAVGSTERLTDGAVSLSGHHMSLLRVGKTWEQDYLRPDLAFQRIGKVGAFGSRAAVYAPVQRHMLLNPDSDFMGMSRIIYGQSDNCRPQDWDVLIETMRGYFELLNLSLKMKDFFDPKRGQYFPTKGTKYLKELAVQFDNDPKLAGFRLLKDFDTAELLY